MKRLSILTIGVSLFAFSAAYAQSTKLVSDIFGDHAVLQRDTPVNIWGNANADDLVNIEFQGKTISTQADKKGKWAAKLPSTPAGGNYNLTISTNSQKQTISDVTFGDVFLCSGQSNMQFGVRGSMGSYNYINNSTNNNIRNVTIANVDSLTKLDIFPNPIKWELASPQTVGNWSAACYFMAEDLYKSTNVPIGLIHSSWGGSSIRAWLSPEALNTIPSEREALISLQNYATNPKLAYENLGKSFDKWWVGANGGDKLWNYTKAQIDALTPAPDISKNFEYWGDKNLENYNGAVWYFKTIELTADDLNGNAKLSLGTIDDFDISFVNGHAVGYISGGKPRNYEIDKSYLKLGTNTIIVNAVDLWAYGGMYGNNGKREFVTANGRAIDLETGWHYKKANKNVERTPRAAWDTLGGSTIIYNAMIAPLGNYNIRAAAWYQGETNADLRSDAEGYKTLLKALMADWRKQFNPNMSFINIELAGFGPRNTAPIDNNWSIIREAQRTASLEDGNAASVVTIDIGDVTDIHPVNKPELGRRMSRAAKSLIYKQNISPSGPYPILAKKAANKAIISFMGIENGLSVLSGKYINSLEVCNGNSCHYTLGVVKNNTIEITDNNIGTNAKIRFCWADSPICNLYDGNGLPVTPFEIILK